MKKKLMAVLAVAMTVALVGCGEEAEEKKNSISKKIDEKIDNVVSDVSKYVDDETDLRELTGTTPVEDSSEEPTTTLPENEPVMDTIITIDDPQYSPDMYFSIVDMNGDVITEDVFREHKVTMINFWEPWCGPCVAEMPELEKLYENYKDKGLYVIGVFSSEDQIEDVKSVLAQAGTTYPIAGYSSAFDTYQTGYVPTTIFVDQDGHVLPVSNGYSDNAVVGSNTYDDWAAIVEKYIK